MDIRPIVTSSTTIFMALDLYELIVDLGLVKVDLIGHSMGGKAAMRLAQLYPEVFNKLIVVDIGPKGYPMHHDVILEGLNAIDFDFVKSRGEADTVLSNYIQDEGSEAIFAEKLVLERKRGACLADEPAGIDKDD
jgi:esterase